MRLDHLNCANANFSTVWRAETVKDARECRFKGFLQRKLGEPEDIKDRDGWSGKDEGLRVEH